MKRPRSHISGDLAVAFLQNVFLQKGWTVESLTQDYGEDLLVRIFDHGVATSRWFFVQSKATDNISKYEMKSGDVSFPFETSHIYQWIKFRHPVIVVVYDTSNEVAYWEDVQESLQDRNTLEGKSKSIRIPRGQCLRSGELASLENHMKAKYEILEEVDETANLLTKSLLEKYGLDVDADAKTGIYWLPDGQFIPDQNGGGELIVFGRMRRLLDKATEESGKNHEDTLNQIIRKDFGK